MIKIPVRGNMQASRSVACCPWCGYPALSSLYAYVDDDNEPKEGYLECDHCGARGSAWKRPAWKNSMTVKLAISEMVNRWNTRHTGYDTVPGEAVPDYKPWNGPMNYL